MKSSLANLGLASLTIGVVNPGVCFLALIFTNLIVLAIVAIVIPLVGISLGIAGLFAPGKIKLAAAAGIVLNLLSIGAIVLLWALFQSSETFGIWR
jgi:hypothetical protein